VNVSATATDTHAETRTFSFDISLVTVNVRRQAVSLTHQTEVFIAPPPNGMSWAAR